MSDAPTTTPQPPNPIIRLTAEAALLLQEIADATGFPKSHIVSQILIDAHHASRGEDTPFLTLIRERMKTPAA